MDRNFVARQRFAEQQRLKKQNAAVRQAVQQGQFPVIDRIGQAIAVGDLFVWKPPFDMVYEVKELAPILDPSVQPGAMRLIVECRTEMKILAGQPQMGMIRVGSTVEAANEGVPDEAPAPSAADEKGPEAG